MWGLVAAVGVIAILIAVILSRPRKHTIVQIESPQPELLRELKQFLVAVNSENDTTSPAYVRAVEQLKDSSDAVLAEARRLLVGNSRTSFGVRHSTLLAVSALRIPDSLDLLSEVALNPQPLPPVDDGRAALNPQPLPPKDGSLVELNPQPEPPGDEDRRFDRRRGHGGEALMAGTMLSLVALDGIKALADDGLAAANEALVRAAGIHSNAVRAVAFAALAADPGRSEYLERAAAGLPAELSHLAQTRYAAIQDVPQVRDPRVHLARTATPSAAPPDPDRGGGDSRPAAPRGRRVPQARRS
jgi:hypothetical protein